jgi:glycosyltransferase involved in cell wall biosynthesis
VTDGIKICINTQTPLVQFLAPATHEVPSWVEIARDLSDLQENVDYQFSPGGVTRMVYPLVRTMLADGTLTDAHWVSLNPSGPETIAAGKLTLHHVALDRSRLSKYGRVKEVLWGAVHGTGEADAEAEAVFWSDDFSEYAYYNRLSAELIGSLDERHDFDVFYIHDFQQLPVGQMLGTLKPKVFRWHIPFDRSLIPDAWAETLGAYLNSYDLVIASSQRYLAALKAFGYRGRARRLYPYVDPREYTRPPPEEVTAVAGRFGVRPDDQVALVVARMDPMKGQDRAIRAVASLAARFPLLRLVLVGNGSFSGSPQGVGLSKSALWRARLEQLTSQLGVGSRVAFAGHLAQRELDAMYERCLFTVLPSIKEGFGLVVVESWLHERPALVTDRAGVVELVRPGVNALSFDPDQPMALAEGMAELLGDPSAARAMGTNGRRTARRCTLAAGVKEETELLRELAAS